MVAGPDRDAKEAADRAGVVIVEATTVDELTEVAACLAAIWDTDPSRFQLGAELLRALSHAGNYVVAVRDARTGAMVGASMGFLGVHGPAGELHLHSHITGVVAGSQGRSIGFAAKQHQRAWSLARGIGVVTWTFDPLVRRNGFFNLAKLGGSIVDYHPNFYGAMTDSINAGDESDRCVVRWDLESPRAVAAAGGAPMAVEAPASAVRLLASDPAGAGPEIVASGLVDRDGPASAVCQVPPDVVTLRATEPALARAWRLALRETLGTAIAAGMVATGMTRDGWYVLERP